MSSTMAATNRICVAAKIRIVSEAPVEHVELALDLHREAADRVFDLERRVGIKMAEAAAQIRGAAHLPEQPGQAFRSGGGFRRQERTELLGEIRRIAPDSKTLTGFLPLRSSNAGIFELGFTATKPLLN
jgi:hypothetical protein